MSGRYRDFDMSGNSIKVVCRFRPQNKLEIKEGGQPIIDIDDEGTSVTLKVRPVGTILPLSGKKKSKLRLAVPLSLLSLPSF